jgi:hypothetical protein
MKSNYYSEGRPRFPDLDQLLFRDPAKRYKLQLHIKRIPLASLPTTEEGLQVCTYTQTDGQTDRFELS